MEWTAIEAAAVRTAKPLGRPFRGPSVGLGPGGRFALARRAVGVPTAWEVVAIPARPLQARAAPARLASAYIADVPVRRGTGALAPARRPVEADAIADAVGPPIDVALVPTNARGPSAVVLAPPPGVAVGAIADPKPAVGQVPARRAAKAVAGRVIRPAQAPRPVPLPARKAAAYPRALVLEVDGHAARRLAALPVDARLAVGPARATKAGHERQDGLGRPRADPSGPPIHQTPVIGLSVCPRRVFTGPRASRAGERHTSVCHALVVGLPVHTGAQIPS